MADPSSALLVRLTESQRRMTDRIGNERQDRAEKYHFRNSTSTDKSPQISRQNHVDAAGAELAVAVWSGLPWTGRDHNAFGAADVGKRTQVRFRGNPAQPDLSVSPKNNPNHTYVLVHRPDPLDPLLFRIVGWILGRDAMRPHYLRKGVYYVPGSQLHEMPHRTNLQPQNLLLESETEEAGAPAPAPS